MHTEASPATIWVLAFITRVMWGRDAAQPELPMIVSTVLHVGVGALLLGRVGNHKADKLIGYAASGILTVAMIWSLGLLVAAIPKHEIDPKTLLRSAAALWVTNVLAEAIARKVRVAESHARWP